MHSIACNRSWFWIVLWFAGGASALAQPNILLIVSEDNGPELGCYGDRSARTPNLDRLASQGMRFEHAFVPYSVCSPSRACFLTGLHAHQNGQIGLATHKFALYRDDIPNAVTLLQPAGYQTGIIGKLHINPASAFPFDFKAIPGANFNRKIKAEDYIQAAAAFWEKAGTQPWFLSVNFPDAHLPFLRQSAGRPASPLTGKDVEMLPWVGTRSKRLLDVMADYYNCLARLDDWVGLLLTALDESGQSDDTLVIYIGDHGAQFPRGKGSVYEGGLRVPLIIRWPGRVRAGIVRKELVSTLDILPTALAAANVDPPAGLSGLALQPLFDGQPAPSWRRYVYAMTTGSFPGNCFVQHAVRDERYKLISSPLPGTENLIANSYLDQEHAYFVISGVRRDERRNVSAQTEAAYRRWERPPRYELYDLREDPHEWNDLAASEQHAGVKTRLISELQRFQRETRDPFLDPVQLRAFVSEQLANRDLLYRKQKDFRWSYLDEFRTWRSARP